MTRVVTRTITITERIEEREDNYPYVPDPKEQPLIVDSWGRKLRRWGRNLVKGIEI